MKLWRVVLLAVPNNNDPTYLDSRRVGVLIFEIMGNVLLSLNQQLSTIMAAHDSRSELLSRKRSTATYLDSRSEFCKFWCSLVDQ